MTTHTICFREASLGPADSPIFQHFDWTVEPYQAWVVTGSNGSGKSAVAQALAGGLPVTSRAASTGGEGGGETARGNQLPDPRTVALISFERQRDVVFDERYHDDSEFVDGGVDPGTCALDFILGRKRGGAAVEAPARLHPLTQRLGVAALLGRGLKYLSTGEIRKVLLCRELLREPAWLIFDEPYEGLDAATRVVLAEEIERLAAASVQPGGVATSRVLVITDRYEHVPSATTHVLHIEDRRVAFSGTRAAFEARGIPRELKELGAAETATLRDALASTLEGGARGGDEGALIAMRSVTVSYGGRRVLDNLNLGIRPGDHTLVRGPNGCGKTTLLNLINGDNPQVYANDVTVCGMKRGSGESVWDVKAKLGQVSYALHVEYAYRCQSNLIETVLSGFYDTIGLYEQPKYAEIQAAERWLGVVGLLEKRAEPFTHLSYGEQRVALILRAVVKQPPLLILDEPCHGLDPRHRSEVLTIADYIGKNTSSTLLYVTHDPEEQLTCTRQIFEFDVERGWLLKAV